MVIPNDNIYTLTYLAVLVCDSSAVVYVAGAFAALAQVIAGLQSRAADNLPGNRVQC